MNSSMLLHSHNRLDYWSCIIWSGKKNAVECLCPLGLLNVWSSATGMLLAFGIFSFLGEQYAQRTRDYFFIPSRCAQIQLSCIFATARVVSFYRNTATSNPCPWLFSHAHLFFQLRHRPSPPVHPLVQVDILIAIVHPELDFFSHVQPLRRRVMGLVVVDLLVAVFRIYSQESNLSRRHFTGLVVSVASGPFLIFRT